MRRLFFCLAVSLAFNACSSQQHVSNLNIVPAQCDPYSNAVRDSIIKLNTSAGTTASGVIVADNRVLTVAHAVDDNREVYAELDGKLVLAQLSAIDKNTDLALLEVETAGRFPVPFSGVVPNVAEPVWAVGFPLAAAQRVSTGFYESVFNGRLYSSVHINSGTSGGGLLRCDDKGLPELAGIVHGYIAKPVGNDLVNIGDSVSVPSATIRTFINSSYTSSGLWVNEENMVTRATW